MSLKDIFDEAPAQIVTKKQIDDLYREAESEGYVETLTEDKERFLPVVDFSSASNFARYGSAEKYYVDAIKNIYQNYPYDGSKKEKQEWRNRSSQLDLYIFDNIYPLSTGYVTLDAGTMGITGSFRSGSSGQYVKIKGGPNPSVSGTFETSNIYDLDYNRESNLGISQLGNTVEFWFKDNLSTGSAHYTSSYCLVDVWNGQAASSDNYTRLTIAKEDGVSRLNLTYRSGSVGITGFAIPYTLDFTDWHHYAVSFDGSSGDLDLRLYVDGALVASETVLGSGSVGLANNLGNIAHLGALRASITTADDDLSGLGNCQGSFDEFRFWKTTRTSQQIYRNWFTPVGGGSNTDDANTGLGVYLKFNEGVVDNTNSNQLDEVCLDYSGRASNGAIINYAVGCKSTGSAINDYAAADTEIGDPIIFSSNPLVQEVIDTYGDLGNQYDTTNSSAIYSSIPAWITEEAEKNGFPDLSYLTQIISSYFDTLHLQIESLSKVKDVEYLVDNKQKTFAKNLLSSNGFQNLEIFNDATFLENVLSRNENEQFEEKLHNIKNAIYQNIYNNLVHIYKSKGTEKSLRNLIRCFGVDDELVKINVYSNNAQLDLETKYAHTSVTKKYIDFNDPDRYYGFIYQKAKTGDSNTKGYIPYINSGGSEGYYVPITVESEVIFPKTPIIEAETYGESGFISASLFGAHEANADDSILAWGSDSFNFQVYSVREEQASPNVYFKLVGGFGNEAVVLTSSVYKDVYDNQKWNFAFRYKTNNYSQAGLTSGSSPTGATIEFIGINSEGDSISNQFFLSSSITSSGGDLLGMNVNKRLYVGAHYNDFDPDQLLSPTDVKIGSLRFWYDYLSNEELIAHSFDPNNVGRVRPNEIPEFFPTLQTTPAPLAKIETLALNWNFYNVTSSDSSGQFIVEDVSSGSVADASAYGLSWLNDALRYQTPGFANEFFENDDQVVNKEFVFAGKKQNPESFYGNDLVQVVNTDDVTKTKDSRITSYYISIEKSMAQVINDEIMNWFATIKAYNNLLGEPIERYKPEYTKLTHLRELFFKRVGNTPSFEKFFEFYKWIDSSLSMMINQLLPASANASDKVRNVIESHMLERSKYESKLPTVEFKDNFKSRPITSHLDYNYREQAAGAARLEADEEVTRYYTFKPRWLKQRALRTESPVNTTLEPANDVDREIMRQVINEKNIDTLPTLYSIETGTYEGKRDALRLFTKVYKLSADKTYVLEDTIEPVSIQNTRINSRFTFASEIATASADTQVLSASSNFNKRGNYQHTYEVVLVSGRSNNNKSLVEMDGNTSGSTINTWLTSSSRTLPDRPTIKNVIVERFSAPGGREVNSRGFLDAAAEEFSVYNSLNHRNITVRKVLRNWLSSSYSIDSASPSYHKINENPSYKVVIAADLSSASYEATYDNAFVQHQIPQNDSQYTWITASLNTNTGSRGFISEFTNISAQYDFKSASSTHDIEIPHIYYRYSSTVFSRTLLNFTFDTDTNTLSLPTNLGIYGGFDYLGLQRWIPLLGGSYNWPTWKQIRNSENLFSVLSRKNNNILVQDKPTQKTKYDENGAAVSYYPRQEATFTAYREPPISYYKPLEQKVAMEGSQEDISLVTSYDANKKYFANDDLNVRVGVEERKELQTYDVIKTLEKDKVFIPSPVTTQVTYSSQLLPSKETAGLSEIRSKPNYSEVAGTGSHGYDRNSADIRTFWRDDVLNYDQTIDNVTEDIFTAARQRTRASAISNGTGSINALNVAQCNASVTGTTFVGVIRNNNSWSTASFTDPTIISQKDYTNAFDSVWPAEERLTVIPSLLVEESMGAFDVYLTHRYDYDLRGDLAGFDEHEARQFLALPSGSYTYETIVKPSGETITQERFAYDTTYNFVRPRASYYYKIHYPSIAWGGLDSGIYSNYTYLLFINNLINLGLTSKTYNIAGKGRWYDSYDEYFEEIRPLTKNHTIIPEFNFSKHDDHYLKEKEADFKTRPPEEYLSIPETDVDVMSYDNTAINVTNKLNSFVFNDYDGKKKLKISVDGIKKLRPFKGFYPEDRTTQIVNLFQKSFWNISTDDLVDGYPTYNGQVFFDPADPVSIPTGLLNGNSVKYGAPLVQQMQTLLQPYFAPGILYNSIKAGIAMDWPAVVTSSAASKDYVEDKQGPVYGPFLEAANTIQLYNTQEIAADSSGSIYVPDVDQQVIYVISSLGEKKVFAGFEGVSGSTDGSLQDARFKGPWGIEYSEDLDELYVCDRLNNLVRKIDFVSTPVSSSVSTIIDLTPYGGRPNYITYNTYTNSFFITTAYHQLIEVSYNGLTASVVLTGSTIGTNTALAFQSPYDVKEVGGDIYVCHPFRNHIIKYNSSGSFTVAYGAVDAAQGSADGYDVTASFYRPWGITQGYDTNYMFVADSSNNTIRKIDLSTQEVTLYAGSTGISEFVNSDNRLDARLLGTYTIDKTDGYMVLLDGVGASQPRIRKISSSGAVTTLAGSGLPGTQNFETASTSIPFFYTTASFTTASTNHERIYTLNVDEFQRIPFESLIDLRGYNENDTLFYLDPTRVSLESFSDTDNYEIYYSGSSPFTSSHPTSPTRYNPQFGFENKNSLTNQTRKFNDLRYQLAINNFLAEVPKFFLQDQKLTDFTSQKSINEVSFIPGKTYEMSVKIEADRDFKMLLDSLVDSYKPLRVNGTTTMQDQIISAASTFGPPTKFFGSSSFDEFEYGHKIYDAPAYAPYAPPYYYGPQIMRLRFNPTQERYTSYQEIINALTVSCGPANKEMEQFFTSSVKDLGGNYEDLASQPAYKNRMPLSSSLRYDIVVDKNETQYDVGGRILSSTNKNDATASRWKIQTKFEAPILNFNTPENKDSNTSNAYNYAGSYASIEDETIGNVMTYSSNRSFGFTGLWSGYSQNTSSGVSLSLVPSKKDKKNNIEDLAEACGFVGTSKKLGKLAGTKEISEAIVLIPFTKKRNHRSNTFHKLSNNSAETIKEIAGETENGPYFFKVDTNSINNLFKQNNINIDFNDLKVPYSDIRRSLQNTATDNSILKSMRSMTEYVLPPHLDWVYNREIEPFVMYLVEFKHKLTSDELADIWQGVMPRAAMQVSNDVSQIEHSFGPSEFFHGRALPEDIQWKVFKVKKRASYSYESLVTGREERFNFGKETRELPFSYNWPYDYFSLVELVNVEASLEVEPDKKEEPSG